jgi:hypothetical protein
MDLQFQIAGLCAHFIDQYCGKYFVADECFFDEIVLWYFG